MRMKHALSAAAIVTAITTPTVVRAAQQPPVHNMAVMGQPASQAAVAECAQAQPQALRTLEAANQRLEAARQSNSPAAMRTAVDDLQGGLRQLRALLGACAGLQAASAAGMPAGHVLPGGQQMPNIAQASPAGPGTAIMNPGSTALAPAAVAPAVADPHAGHVMPAAPQTAAAPRAPPAPRPAAAPGTPPRMTPSPVAASDPHAGMVMPAAPPVQAAGAEATAAHAMTTVENPATSLADLMCQPQVDPDTAPRATYLGKAHYFCTVADRDLFLKAPAKYLQR